ncbi:uncharacterized protein TNCV_1641812 [Trichonephila clavipes]|nr:uncharacterized protein TNCV_1641812 [Trichonephila clavipes]
MNEDDIEELIMGHEDELTTEELQEILNEEHQETPRNVSPSEQEEDERGPMPTSAIKDLLKKWEAVRAMVLEWHSNQADVIRFCGGSAVIRRSRQLSMGSAFLEAHKSMFGFLLMLQKQATGAREFDCLVASMSFNPTLLHAEIVEVEIEVVSPSIVPSGNLAELNRTVTCMVLKANDRRTSCPCHDEFRGPRSDYVSSCQVIYSQFGLAIHQNDHRARRRFVEWAQNEIAVVPDFHKRILFSDEAHFWLNGYVNKQNCRIWSEANPQVYVETPLHPEKRLFGAHYGLVEIGRTSSKTMKATTLQSMVIGIEP